MIESVAQWNSMKTKTINRVAEKIIGSIGTLAEERLASNMAIDDVLPRKLASFSQCPKATYKRDCPQVIYHDKSFQPRQFIRILCTSQRPWNGV
jgi:hypothetical protein